ncbi:hypothetical protein [Bacillus phage 1]|uniref:Uncharacterized protein n=1 Tax=Bacillus phage 1 TaxID=2785079 RepID=A6XMM1_9CAUD|nr:hypothetical protein BV1_gp50 [Bacillus phage 1]ABJ09644.1 hypothetical protein [Bacillus phage 1]
MKKIRPIWIKWRLIEKLGEGVNDDANQKHLAR